MVISLCAFLSRLSKGIISMKHTFNISKSTALVCALGAVFATNVSAQSATPNVGKLTIDAEVIKATCVVLIGDTATSANQTSYKALNLGNQAGPNTAGVAGEAFGTAKQVVFSLKSPTDTTAECDLGATTVWRLNTNLVVNPTAPNNQVVTINGKQYLKNAMADGTDAVVGLFVGTSQIPLANGNTVLMSSGPLTKVMVL